MGGSRSPQLYRTKSVWGPRTANQCQEFDNEATTHNAKALATNIGTLEASRLSLATHLAFFLIILHCLFYEIKKIKIWELWQ